MHGPVELRLVKAISHKRRDPHSGVGVSTTGRLHFHPGKFDPRLGVLHAEVLGITAPLQFTTELRPPIGLAEPCNWLRRSIPRPVGGTSPHRQG